MLFFAPLVVISALASRALATFNITVNNVILTTDQIFDVPTSAVTTACATDCTDASSALQACNDDATCLCSADSVASLLSCEQCMFTKLIEANEKAPDFRVGSQPLLSAYATSCSSAANVTLLANQTALQLPLDWDGPFVAVLPVPAAAIAVASAAILGSSALYILSNM
ncbi:hypothetical protein H0H92_014583 [Tricholoma furcatifolium]|nr:hypothetical protein H0H92_014583 [Tricholoma furcatifolium]